MQLLITALTLPVAPTRHAILLQEPVAATRVSREMERLAQVRTKGKEREKRQREGLGS
jgi:hypothetical protein